MEALYGIDSKPSAWVDSTGSWKLGHVWAGNWNVATYVNNTTYFTHSDSLGSARVWTDPTGAVVDTCSMLAYGDRRSCTPPWGGQPSSQFTGSEYDSESNLDHFWFRQYSST